MKLLESNNDNTTFLIINYWLHPDYTCYKYNFLQISQ